VLTHSAQPMQRNGPLGLAAIHRDGTHPAPRFASAPGFAAAVIRHRAEARAEVRDGLGEALGRSRHGAAAPATLPLGAGTVDIRKHVGVLKNSDFDGTITLEAFTPDRHYLAYSRDWLRSLWDESNGDRRG
jgi:hypothetical protein